MAGNFDTHPPAIAASAFVHLNGSVLGGELILRLIIANQGEHFRESLISQVQHILDAYYDPESGDVNEVIKHGMQQAIIRILNCKDFDISQDVSLSDL